MTNKTDTQDLKIAMHVSVVSIIANLSLSLFKLVAGLLGRSAAMVSDAVHSASDVFSTVVVMIGVSIAHKAPDDDHPYGHDRMENAAAVLLAVVLALTGIGIGWSGIRSIAAGHYDEIAIPTLLPLAAAIVSIAVKEGMFWYTKAAAQKTGSEALLADAWHHRSDSLSSIGSLVGIIGARMGFPVFDPIASVVICLFIIKAAYDIFSESLNKMVDKSCDDDTIEQMKRTVLDNPDVIVLDELKTRLFGSKCYVDIEIGADGNMTLFEAHAIAQSVHDQIEAQFHNVKHCMVHVNPIDVDSLNLNVESKEWRVE